MIYNIDKLLKVLKYYNVKATNKLRKLSICSRIEFVKCEKFVVLGR